METTLVKPKEKVKIPVHKFMLIKAIMYKIAKRIEANRQVNEAHVLEMIESIKRNGILRDVILGILNGVYYIVDGQHLFEALKRLGLDVPCKVVEFKNKADMVQKMIDLNTTSRGWKLPDYISGWAWLGKKDYVELKAGMNFHMNKKKDITQETVIMMAYANESNRCALSKATKNGEFKVKSFTQGERLLAQVIQCNKFFKASRNVNQALITLMIEEGKDYKHAKFMNALRNSPDAIQKAKGEEEKMLLVALKDIYRGNK